jgi:hypothetical protein
MGLPKRLTEMQIKFAHELITNEGKMNGKEAAVAAGYSQDRASVTASELQNAKVYPLVCEYIEKLRTEKSEQNKLMLRDNLFRLNKLMGKAIETLEKRIDCKPNEIIKICRSFKPIFNILNSLNNDKKIKVYLAEEQRPYSTNHYKIGMTTQQSVEDRMNPTDNPYGLNYICFVEYSVNNGFNLEKAFHNFFKEYSTYNDEYGSSASEWFHIKHKDKFIKQFKEVGYSLLEENNCQGMYYETK